MCEGMKVQYNFKIYKGEDLEIPINFSTVENGINVPLDITSAQIKMTVRDYVTNNVVDELSTENGRIVKGQIVDGGFVLSPGHESAILIDFGHEITESITYKQAVYDIFRVDPDAEREVLLVGRITVERGVTYAMQSNA